MTFLINNQDGFSWEALLLGIIYIIAGIIAFNNPLTGAVVVVYFFAFSAIIKGIFEFYMRRRLKDKNAPGTGSLLLIGIFDLIIGAFLLFNVFTGVIALPYIFAVWFIVDSLATLFNAPKWREISTTRFWINIVIGILGIVAAVLLFLNPVVSIFTISMLVAFYFVIHGVGYVFSAF